MNLETFCLLICSLLYLYNVHLLAVKAKNYKYMYCAFLKNRLCFKGYLNVLNNIHFICIFVGAFLVVQNEGKF